MELIQGLIQPPKAQSVDETIPTLSDRAESATLIGDRRSAVLGLKAFSRDYREAVIASGLKPLLNTLKRDYEDEATVKAILETLLILFIRGDGNTDLTRSWISQQSRLQNGKYPSPLLMKQELQQVDQFSLWIADAITQSDEIVHLILELLETENFHIRLYTIQLLEAVVATRPVRSRNAINSLPTGVSTLVSLLDDVHEVVRDEAVLLLMAVVNDSPHVQKLVAFENIFDRLFAIISEEGGLRGSLVISDCLSLINNILKFNTSNQSLFLETGNLPKLASILDEPLLEKDFFWNDQRIVNIKTALDIVSLTVEPGSSTTSKNQTLLLESNVFMIVLRLAFYEKIPKRVRPIALLTAAGITRGNENCQRDFGKIDVPFFDPTSPALTSSEDAKLLPVVGLLIHWILYANSVQAFQTRVASLELVKAYLYDNEDIQEKFLSQQIESYCERSNRQQDNEKFGTNLLEALLDYDPDLKLNPYKVFFAADLLLFLFQTENKHSDQMRERMLHVKTGVEVDGVETLSSVQTLSELLTTSLSVEDIRIPISYATLLIFWLYADRDAVNEFLSERSIVQSLSSFCYQLQDDDVTVKCLVTMLLGVAYEFSSDDSPFPRKEYYEYLAKTLGQDNYLSRINQFKEKSLFTKEQSSGTILSPAIDDTGLPQVYFSPIFVQFFNDNSYRIKTALLHKPEEKPLVDLSFEQFEELQKECSQVREKISSLQESSQTKIDQLKSEYNDIEKAYHLSEEQRTLVDKDYSALLIKAEKLEKDLEEAVIRIEHLEDEGNQLSKWKEEKLQELKDKESKLVDFKEKSSLLEKELKSLRAEKEKAENGINKMNRELLKLTKENDRLQDVIKQLEKAKSKDSKDLEGKRKELEDLNKQCQVLQEQNREALTGVGHWEARFNAHDELVSKLTEKLRSVAESLQKSQKERDDLRGKIESLQAEHNQSLTKCHDDYSALSDEHSKMIRSQEENIVQLAQLEQTIRDLEEKSKAEQLSKSSVVKDLESGMTELNEELRGLRDQRELLEKKNGQLKESIASYEASSKETNTVLEGLKKDMKLSEESLTRLENEKQAAEDLNESQKRELTEALKASKAAEDECKVKTEMVTSLRNEINESQVTHTLDVEKYKKEVETLKEERATMTSLISDLEKSIAGGKENHARLESDIQQLDQDKKLEQQRSTKEKAQLDEEIGKLKKDTEELQSKLTNTQQQKKTVERELTSTKEHDAKLVAELDSVKATADEKDVRLKQLEEAKEGILSQMRQTEENSEKTKKELDSKIQELQSKLKDRTKEFEAERKLLNEGSNSVTQEYSERVSTLEDKLDEVEKEYESTKKQLENSRNNLELVESDSKKSLKASQDRIQSLNAENGELRKQTEEAEQTHKKLNDRTEKERADLKSKLESLERSVKEKTEANELLQSKIDKMNSDLTAEFDNKVQLLEKQRAGLQQEVEKLTSENTNKVQDMESKLDALSKKNNVMKAELEELSDLLKENDSTINGSVNLKDCFKHLAEKATASEQASIEYKNTIIQNENQIKSLIEESSSLTAQASSDKSEVLELRSLIDSRNKEIETLEESRLSEVQQLRDQLDALNRQNEDLLKKAKNDSELDDLMLLVTDLDERNTRYRKLLQTNGIDLPSDDDDEDDEDDSDDDEGDD